MMFGTLYAIGIDPGDPELITLKEGGQSHCRNFAPLSTH
jgi:precorrin-4 methylase